MVADNALASDDDDFDDEIIDDTDDTDDSTEFSSKKAAVLSSADARIKLDLYLEKKKYREEFGDIDDWDF